MPGPNSARRTARPLAVVLAILLLVVVAERSRWFARLEGVAQPKPTWIWAPFNPNLIAARAFYAVRDFEVAAVPSAARMEVLGDPEYVAYLNGARVGSGSYRADMPLDVYDVAPLLRPGANRVVVELRSAIGSGAATLRVVDGAGATLVRTGSDWSIQETTWQGAMSLGEPLARSIDADVLGVSPFGRWGLPAVGPRLPLFGERVSGELAIGARLERQPYGSGRWRRLPPSAKGSRSLGAATEFDFGHEVEGYLRLVFDRGRSRTALVRARSEPASSSGWTPDAIAITVNGAGVWVDALPRRFRYVEVVGLRGLRWAGYQPLRPGAAARAELRPPAPRGLFGLRLDPPRWPAVDEIWKEWVDLPRVAARVMPERPPQLRRGGGARTPARPREHGARHPRGKSPAPAKPVPPTAAPSR